MPDSEAPDQLNAMLRSAATPAVNREMLADRSEAGQEMPAASRRPEALHAPFSFPGRLMAILGPIVHPGRGVHEDMLDAGESGLFCIRGWIAAHLAGDNLARAIRILGQQPPEETFGGCGVTLLLQQDVEFGAMLIGCLRQT